MSNITCLEDLAKLVFNMSSKEFITVSEVTIDKQARDSGLINKHKFLDTLQGNWSVNIDEPDNNNNRRIDKL